MDLKKVMRWYVPLLILVILVFFVGYFLPPVLHFGSSIAALIAFSVWSYRAWRCPDCGKSLGRVRIASQIVCPGCGKKHKLI